MNRTMPRKRALVQAGNEAADNLVALLGHCEFCKRMNLPLCQVEIHDLPKRVQVLVGLAILWHSRPTDFDLRRFIEIECPAAPNRYTQREVDLWVCRLTHPRSLGQ